MPRKPQPPGADKPEGRPSPAAKKPAPLGTDPALALPTAHAEPLHLTYWDLWFALVAVNDYGGDLRRLGEALGTPGPRRPQGREAVAGKRSHLRDLERRLAMAGKHVRDVVAAAGPLASAEQRRARGRVLEGSERQYERSESMKRTLHERGQAHALRGFWPRFPVSPEPFAQEIGSHFKTRGFYGEEDSFGLSARLDRYVTRADALRGKGRSAEAQALLRALLTVVIELLGMADDSFGCIGQTFEEAFTRQPQYFRAAHAMSWEPRRDRLKKRMSSAGPLRVVLGRIGAFGWPQFFHEGGGPALARAPAKRQEGL